MWRVAVVFIIFMGFVISIVVYTAFLGTDLVAEDYYQQEVNYQGIIDAKNNSVEIKKQLSIKQNETSITILFPKVSYGSDMKGTVHFYHPKSSKFDFEKPLKLVGGNQVFNKSNLLKGNYIIKFQWDMNGEKYYIEKPYYIS